MPRGFVVLLLICLLKWVLIHGQDQSGFTSLACGSVESYTDILTGINYVPDGSYIDSGELKFTESESNIDDRQFTTYRGFPNGGKNCYTLPLQHIEGTQYLIRAGFDYNNFINPNASSSSSTKFDIYIGVNFWSTVIREQRFYEMTYVPSSNVTHICLVNTGYGIPFISVLEWRLLKNVLYKTNATSSLSLAYRVYLGYSYTDIKVHLLKTRYQDDVYDRIWESQHAGYNTLLSTPENVYANIYNQPQEILRSAMPIYKNTKPLQEELSVTNTRIEHHVYFHTAEIERLEINQSRQFDVYHNGLFLYGPITPKYLVADTHYFVLPPFKGEYFNFSLRSNKSSLPPLFSAIEIYTAIKMPQLETHFEDVQAIKGIRSTYAVSGIWQGDPCAPMKYSWEGVKCNLSVNLPPRIITLNLSSSNLAGDISEYFYGLKLLQQLDLSYNSLHGVVPEFLGNMSSLKFLNLEGNNFTGALPSELTRKFKDGSLKLYFGGNPNLCSGLCTEQESRENSTKKYTPNHIISIAAHVVGGAAIVLLLVILIVFRKKLFKRKITLAFEDHNGGGTSSPGLKSRNRRFNLSEILRITSNFNRVIGKGGFGTVYHGFLDRTEVAVKMLSPSSSQGFKEFKAEAQILTRVHHRNLTSLVGYCDESGQLGLIYEFMANGNLGSHISDGSPLYLTWEYRLRIALDASIGLEYLHSGCKPPIIHRDIKPTNILLDGNYQAKLSDFGLSRMFENAGGDTEYEPTGVAGTRGYLDPEYYNSQKLSEKSDVFSYGVVLLEIITGQPAISKIREEPHIAKWVGQLLDKEGDVKLIVDPRLLSEYNENSVWKSVELAMKCVSTTSEKRPTMSEVVIELSECLTMEQVCTTKMSDEGVISVITEVNSDSI